MHKSEDTDTDNNLLFLKQKNHFCLFPSWLHALPNIALSDPQSQVNKAKWKETVTTQQRWFIPTMWRWYNSFIVAITALEQKLNCDLWPVPESFKESGAAASVGCQNMPDPRVRPQADSSEQSEVEMRGLL